MLGGEVEVAEEGAEVVDTLYANSTLAPELAMQMIATPRFLATMRVAANGKTMSFA